MAGFRRFLYRLARIMGDVSAIASGSPARMGRRTVNKAVGRQLRRLWR